MLSPLAFKKRQRQAHGPRVQAKAISYISQKIEIYEAFLDVIGPSAPTLTIIFKDCSAACTTDVSVNTLHQCWSAYDEWGELPHKVTEQKRLMKARDKNAKRNQLLDDGDLLLLKKIGDENTDCYLDELAFLFGMSTGNCVHYSTTRRSLVEKLDYSMKVLQTIAKQQCEQDEIRFLQAMEIYLQSNPDRRITIDEMYRDRNAARRRRGWGHKGNFGGVTVKAWFDNIARYTFIAAVNVNGFIPSACHTVLRDELSDEGTTGTVDGEYFLHLVKDYLCHILGNYALGEPRSVMMMDNASTHMKD